MRVVLFATGHCPAIDSLNGRTPAPLLPLVDRPFIHHVVESLAAEGATRFDVVLSSHSEKFQDVLGDGSRWGVQFNYHCVPSAKQPYGVLSRIKSENPNEPILLAHADRLPQIQPNQLRNIGSSVEEVTYFLKTPAPNETEVAFEWAGWACIPASLLSAASEGMDEKAFGDALLMSAGTLPTQVAMPAALSARTFAELIASQSAVLSGAFSGIELVGRVIAEGVRAAHNAVVHASAKITGPAFLGANCRIEAGAEIGRAVISEGCIVDRGTSIENSLVMQETYVGEGLELDHCVADAKRLVHTRINSAITVTDDMYLSSTQPSLEEGDQKSPAHALASNAAGVVLLVLTFPLYAALWVIGKFVRPGQSGIGFDGKMTPAV